MKNSSILRLSSIVTLLLLSCDNQEREEVSISKEDSEVIQEDYVLDDVTNSHFKNIEFHKEIVNVLNEEGGRFKFMGGSSLDIPKNCFSYLDGTPVVGEVEIIFQEFNELSDIILAGIDMSYDSAGVAHNFVSAGMFYLEGEQDGKPIAISENKEITVNSVTDISDEKDGPFNFYTMNKEGNWEYETTKIANNNPDYQEVEKLKEPQKPTQEDLVIETVHGETGNGESMLWKYAGLRPDTVNMEKLNSTQKKVAFEKTNLNQLSYELIFTLGANRINVPVEPLFVGEDYSSALTDFERNMKRIENDQEALEQMAEGKFIRSIGVNAFGLCNWDKIYQGTEVPLHAELDPGFDLSPSLISYHQVSKSANFTVSFNSKGFENIKYLPDDDNIFIATAPGNKVSVIDSKTFFSILNKRKGKEKITLQLTPLEEEVATKEDLKNLIARL